MQENKDYEQLYYDSLYELKNLKIKIKLLEQDLKLFKEYGNKKITKFLLVEIINYTKSKANK